MKQKKLVLTPEEENLILEKRKQKELEEGRDRPKKIGYLKHDLYFYISRSRGREDSYSDIITQFEKDLLVRKFLENFNLISTNTKFECYFTDNGVEYWNEEDGWIQEQSSDWAKENLINIQDIK